MTKRVVLISALALAMTAQFASPAQGAECGDFGTLSARLLEVDRQAPIGMGEMPEGFIQVFATETSDKWTILFVGRDGAACILEEGTDWQAFVPRDDPT